MPDIPPLHLLLSGIIIAFLLIAIGSLLADVYHEFQHEKAVIHQPFGLHREELDRIILVLLRHDGDAEELFQRIMDDIAIILRHGSGSEHRRHRR